MLDCWNTEISTATVCCLLIVGRILSKTFHYCLALIVQVEKMITDTRRRLEQQLKDEQDARLKAEAAAREAQLKTDEEKCMLRERLERSQREVEVPRNRRRGCLIL